ncbi:MAG TPA: DUF4175 family protein [Acetobacteraceae bacterium]|nr:DUF4175 family protein [Acetobacteraceae bacterium]
MDSPRDDPGRRLARQRALAWATLLFERLWPALWPPLGIAGVFACLALLNVPRLLPPLGQAGLLAAFSLACAALLARGLARLRAPSRDEVDRRLERASGLRHRPLAALSDRPAVGDETALAVWRVHVARAAGQIRRLRVGVPHPGLAQRDRWALRGGLIVALIACGGVAGPDGPARLGAALTPSLPRGAPAPETELQAWITPPAYTGLAPMFLKPGSGAVRAPAGSRLTVNVTGDPETPSLELAGRRAAFRALDTASFQVESTLSEGGWLAVRRGGRTLGGWDLTVVPDHPPEAAWNGKPGPGRTRLSTRLPWRASDDYGVTGLAAELRLRDNPNLPPLVVPVPVPATAKEAHGAAEPDLTAHPWAGLPVIARLTAHDGAGQTGRSADATLILPERSFRNPEARALIAIRKGLAVRPDDRAAALAGLDALLVEPGSIGKDFGTYVNLSGIYYLLEFDQEGGAVGQAQERLWQLALQLEEGAAARTEQALTAARQAADEALAKLRADPSQANRTELEKKLQELREAIRQHMQALAQQFRDQLALRAPMDPEMRRLSARDLERMAQRALEAARQGGTEQAAKALAELERKLDALRNAKPMTEADRARAEQRRKGREGVGAVQDLLAREGGLLDHAQQRAREAGRNGDEELPQPGQAPSPGAPPPGAPRGAPSSAARAQDQRVQQALRRALGEVMQQLGDLTGKVPDGLGEADRAMQNAAKALAEGRDGAAQGAEMKAIEALQKGGREAGQQMAGKFGRGQNGPPGQEGAGEGEGESESLSLSDDGNDQAGEGGEDGQQQAGQVGRGRDPLGRTGPGGEGVDEGSDVTIPDQGDPKRTQQIEQELRRRGADRSRRIEELEYIERLLKQF